VTVLSGLTVVALEQAVAAPFATRQLADLGARVIKIERPGAGDFARDYDTASRGMSSHFVWINRGKESVELDLKTPLAVEVVHRLLARADVFVENLAPGAATRLGLGPEELATRHPGLITCSISGYGSDGPYRDKKAYDLLVQAEAGVLSVTGTPEEPAKAGIAVADIAGGTYAFAGILTALLDRERTGQARRVEVSLFEALAEWMGFPLAWTAGTGRELPRAGAWHAAIQPYGPFAAGNGEGVLLGVQNQREWARFCHEVLRRPELAEDSRFRTNEDRVAHRDELRAAIEEVFRPLSAAEVVGRLDAAQIANARFNTVADVLDHPSLHGRGRWRQVGSPVGPLPALIPPATLSGLAPEMGDIPALGQHTRAVLAEAGCTDDELDRLTRRDA
jgi:itaconate CoA-transferase